MGDLPKLEPTAYAYEYEETRSFPEELQEWFQYTEEERFFILGAKESFDEAWEPIMAKSEGSDGPGVSWTEATETNRKKLVKQAVAAVDSDDVAARVNSLGALSYIALGAWSETAGADQNREAPQFSASTTQWLHSQSAKPACQLQWIIKGAQMLWEGGIMQ